MVCIWFVCGNFDVFPNRQIPVRQLYLTVVGKGLNHVEGMKIAILCGQTV